MIAKLSSASGSVNSSLTLLASSIARRPSFSASSFLPKPASISPSSASRHPSSGWARISSSCCARALIKAARADVSSPFKRATTPTQKSRPSPGRLHNSNGRSLLAVGLFFWASTAAKRPAASQSRSIKARLNRHPATNGSFSDPGSFVRILSIVERKGPVSARRAYST